MARSLIQVMLIILVMSVSAIAQSGSISLDYIGGLIGPDTVCADRPIVFGLRVTNSSGSVVAGYTHGFRVYSPTGAVWSGTFAEYVGSFADYFDQTFIEYRSADGVGADTVGFTGFAITSSGLPSGFSDISLQLTITPSQAWEGHTICLDSTWFAPSGTWQWSVSSQQVYPSWDGPHCFLLHRLPCADTDGDGVLCGCDNCEGLYNPAQADNNFDYIGDACQCCVMRGDVTHNGAIDIADLTYLVKIMFIIDFPQVCRAEVDVNGDGTEDISDLTYLVKYMFFDGPDPVTCP